MVGSLFTSLLLIGHVKRLFAYNKVNVFIIIVNIILISPLERSSLIYVLKASQVFRTELLNPFTAMMSLENDQ